MFDLSDLREPIVQAPMAGGPSTPQLAIAVCEAGGLGFLAAGYKRADAVRGEIQAVRGATEGPFGVNLFVPAAEPGSHDPGSSGSPLPVTGASPGRAIRLADGLARPSLEYGRVPRESA